jgi:ribosome modulation factor
MTKKKATAVPEAPKARTTDEKRQDLLGMTAETCGLTVLQVCLQEMKLMPDVWPKLSEAKQNAVIDRLRATVANAITMAVHTIASDGRITVIAGLEGVAIKDEIKATFVVSRRNEADALQGLYDSHKKVCLLVVATPEVYKQGMDDVKGESDQRAMDLGQEYKPNSDGEGMERPEDGNVIDVLAIENKPKTELEQAYDDGQLAAQEGLPKEDCPEMSGELCAEWVRGWEAWHAEHTESETA